MSEPQGGQSPAQLQSQHHHHHHHHLQNEYNEAIQNMDQVRYVQPTQEVQPVLKDPLPQEIFNQGRSASEEIEALSCSFCVYTDVCMIPQARICVRTYRDRSGPLMQVLDWGLQIVIKIDDLVNSHQDLISGMAVNDQGTLLASCSIDGTVRVWNIQSPWCQSGTGGGATAKSFKENLEKHGCPIVSHTLLLGHIGWVNAVDIKNTTIVSGGSDHTTRIWDGISGKIIRIIPNLFLTRQLNLGVYVVAIHGSLIGSGSIIEGYQIHDLETGELVMDLDEPLCSKDHARFESELYQLYSSNMVITDTVIVTNSKLEGMLCVWDRHTGDFLYRIQVSPTQNSAIDLTSNESTASSDIKQLKTYTSSACSKHIGTSPDVNIVTVHSFKVNRSGSRLICTLCDGSVSLIDFKKLPSAQMNPWNVEYNVRAPLEQVGAPNSSATAWVWVQDARNGNRVMLI
ncbi:hypothetical protein BGZ76_008692 [Entomortierella beljakovae]|nr:hypothetical protein BGZ76_008692 [Entomortierella beljakovae]